MKALDRYLASPDGASLPRRTAYALCFQCCLITVLSVIAIAQQDAKDLGDASLQELGNIKVYSAAKHLQSVHEAPSSVTVITRDDIQKYGYRNFGEILQAVRGFYVTYDRNYAFVGVRGFGRLGDWNSRVLLLIDGHRINNNVLGEAMLGSEFLIDIDLIDRVEIVRGPSSSLYGTDAFFAVINVITRKPAELKGTELAFARGSFGTYQGRASYGGEYKGVGLMLSGTFYNSAGPTLFFPQFNTPANNNGVTSDTSFESFQQIAATVSYRGLTFEGLFRARDKGNPTAYFGTVFNDPITRNIDYHQYFDLSYRHSLGEKWEFTARTSYDQARLQAPLALSDGGEVTNNTYSFRGNWFDGEAQVGGTLWEKNKVTVGTEILDNLREDQADYSQLGNTFTPVPGSSKIWALYGQDEFALLTRLTLSAGVRYDHYDTFGGTTNPRLALIYHVFQPTTVKLIYGSAFRAPEPFEATPGFGPFYENNPALQPETIHSVEAVVEHKLNQQFDISGSVFRNKIRNLISLEIDPSNSQAQYVNSAGATATGLEAELGAHFADRLKTTVSYSFTDVESNSPQDLDNSPHNLGKLNLSSPLVRKKLFASLDAQYTSARETLAGNTVRGFSVFNFTLLGHALGRHLDLSGSVYNVFNKKYFDPGRPEDPEDAIQQDGRTFRIKVTGRF